MTIFNPEHDLCMANGDANFVPPSSALKFAKDCESLVSWIDDASGDKIIPWGWDVVLKRRLQKSGVPDDKLPSDEDIYNIRCLSHRRVAADANSYVNSRVSSNIFRPDSEIVELFDADSVVEDVEQFGDAVAKSPWSGSGKGLRWLRSGELTASDLGWCRNVIDRQGSVMLEKRHRVVQDFAMLFSITDNSINFEGYSIFFNDNGIYKGNVLAGDDWILRYLTDKYLPGNLIPDVGDALLHFLLEKFLGRYVGYLGVDMFIYGDSEYRLAPCVEINTRMTMGLLARRLFDNHLAVNKEQGEVRLVPPCGVQSTPGCLKTPSSVAIDGKYLMTTEYSPRPGELYDRFVKNGEGLYLPLNEITSGTEYAVGVSPVL